jgi:MOSC domain-containing protein YiiM
MNLVSIQTGTPQTHNYINPADGRPQAWTSGIFKLPVPGPVRVTTLGLEGDGVADAVNHGGPDKAVHAYSLAHYAHWRAELGRAAIDDGSWGENLTVRDASEQTVCIGDVWQVGSATLQVSQPRQPCWKLARKHAVPDLVTRVVNSARTGWYLRVLEEGAVQPGDAITLADRAYPSWTVARAVFVFNFGRADVPGMEALAAIPVLAKPWREGLYERLRKM